METDVQYGVQYGEPVQGGEEKVTRQVGIDRRQQQLVNDPQPPQPVIQGSSEIFTTRNAGPHVTQQFASDGTLHSDHRSDDTIFFAEHPLSDPVIVTTDVPMPPPAAFVSDDGGADPRAKPSAPVIITPEQVAAARAAAKKGGK